MRAVARAVGVAATSVYLHFDNVDSLVRAVAERHFDELARLQGEAASGLADPCARVLAVALTYCEFGLDHPGQYWIMFSNPLPPPPLGEGSVQEQVRRRAFDRLIEAIAACLGGPPGEPESFQTATLVWQQLHGLVSLRICRPRFPWPPLADTVTDTIDRLLAGARARGGAR